MSYAIDLGDLPPLSDKCLFPPSVLEEVLELHPTLPHPLVFRLSGEKSVLVGVREFTAPNGSILVPENVLQRLGPGPVSVQLAQLPPATFLQVKPAQFYPHITNWKYYLESFVSKNYTTMSKGQTFGLDDKTANTVVQLTVEDANADSVVVVDTDIVLDVVPLDDVMAAQQLDYTSTLATLENVPELTTPVSVEIEPFHRSSAPVMFAVDLKKVRGAELTLSIATDSDLANVDLLCGLDKLVTLENFAFCTVDQDAADSKLIVIDMKSDLIVNHLQKYPDHCTVYVVPFAWEHEAKVTVAQSAPTPTLEKGALEAHTLQGEGPGATQVNGQGPGVCSNCGKVIAGNMALHEAFCLRNNVRCSCGEVFRKEIPGTHWHCDQCSVHGNSALFRSKHVKLFHSGPYKCQCGDAHEYADFIQLVQQHKAAGCPARLHECMFCHLIVPQEQATYEDNFANLTHHESLCGNKTTECYQCGKVLRNKDLASHMKMHYLDKVERSTETLLRCANETCVSVFARESDVTNDLGLCDACFGPLYLTVHDPTRSKLQSRIERRYMLQLTKGCGHAWCTNDECATGGRKLDIKLALAHIKSDLLPQVSGLPVSTNHGRSRFWFCINESSQSRKNVVHKLISEGLYGENMIYKAVAARPSEDGAREWLIRHAIST